MGNKLGGLAHAENAKGFNATKSLPELPWLQITYTPDDTDLIKAMKFLEQLRKMYGTEILQLAYQTHLKVTNLQLKDPEVDTTGTSEAQS